MIFVGIDPGLDGAVAAIDAAGNIVTCQDTPTATIRSNNKNRRRYLPGQMANILSNLTKIDHCKIKVVGLEFVRAMPGQGVSSMFCMGQGVGMWEGIIAALRLPTEQITPQRWKKAIMTGAVGEGKEASILRAQQLFPNCGDLLNRKKDHGRADALLIAEYLRKNSIK